MIISNERERVRKRKEGRGGIEEIKEPERELWFVTCDHCHKANANHMAELLTI